MNISEWMEKYKLQYKKSNERPWGSYEIAISLQNTPPTWVIFERTFGWGFTEKDCG